MSIGAVGDLDTLRSLADTLAGAWAGRAAASTTLGQERAILRLCGIGGLDRDGRPLAATVIDRYIGTRADRLAAGILLPFAMALLEYDVAPQDLALDVASGNVDLALEADLLNDRARRGLAEAEAGRLAAQALDRIDANRTARRELLGVLGDAPQPWFGTTVEASDVDAARAEALRLVDNGADLVRISVPAGRELSTRAEGRGTSTPTSSHPRPGAAPDLEAARVRRGSVPYTRPDIEGIPAGSQRGLADLRHAIDETAASRRRYVRLAALGPALAAPDLAVVAGFERIDVVEVDPIAEIVDEGINPDRALADHAFAHRLLRRAGAQVLVGPGPLVVAPDIARGMPSDPGTRAGRAIALQLLSVALARHQGLTAEQILVGAVPAWIPDEREPAVQAIAQVALRRALFAGHALAFDEPAVSAAAEGWPFVFAAAVPGSEPTALVLRRAEPARVRQVGEATRAAARVAREVGHALGPRALHGAALDHARSAVDAAQELLEGLLDQGWRSVIGGGVDATTRGGVGVGWDTVVERSDDFDPFSLDRASAVG
jgi:beta-lysine 5,6-aminomutase alpha subunit